MFKKIFNKVFSNNPTRALPKDGKPFVANINGIRLEIDPNEYIDSSIFTGSFEPDTVEVFDKLVKPGCHFMDIGANIGFFTLLVAKKAGAKGHVVAFEPTEYGYRKITKNLGLNSFKNIVLEKIALSDKNEKSNAFFNSSWPIDNQFDQKEKVQEQMKFETLDSYVKRNSIKKIDVLKIDVDGFEYKILRGAEQTLSGFNPILILEVCGYTLKRNGASIADMVTFLQRLGYNFFSEKTLQPIRDMQAEITDNPLFDTHSMNFVVSKKPNF